MKGFFPSFHSQDLISDSLYCLPYKSYDVRSENLVLDQLIIPSLIFFLNLITCLFDITLILWWEILSWSPMGVECLKPQHTGFKSWNKSWTSDKSYCLVPRSFVTKFKLVWMLPLVLATNFFFRENSLVFNIHVYFFT